MKLIVCVKQVPDTSGKVAVNADGTLDRASMQTIINPDDMNAVEAALSLKDELGCKVVAFTMGPPPAEGMLRELMAMGVDEGVLVTAREFGGAAPPPPRGATQGPATALGYSQSWTMSGGSTGELYLSKLEKKLLGVGSRLGAHSPLEDLC